MEVYLVQHGEAKAKSEDPERPLTERGREDVERTARKAGKLVKASQVFHSGKLRARQTAEIIAGYISAKVVEKEGLGAEDDPEGAKKLISDAGESLVIVGHLPQLGRLAGLLVVGNSELEVVRFTMGGMVCLREESGKWLVDWVVKPEQAETG